MNQLLALVLCTIFVELSYCEFVSVHTAIGTITGTLTNITIKGNVKSVREFLGIPYARAPVGSLRFSKPLKRKPFIAPYKATSFGPVCPQGGVKIVPMNKFKVSEDCLLLNIFVPHTAGSRNKYAVMVYIHGGGFVTGTSNIYVGDVLSTSGDVIVVTINYRLSILGFLSSEDGQIKGNYGLWDQHMAIQWVHDNIRGFQGDPDNVAIFGQAAGADCVLYQALYPGNKGLFHRVIVESGRAMNIGPLNIGPKSYQVDIATIAHITECSQNSIDGILNCLRLKDLRDIFTSLSIVFFQIPFGPVYDGDFIKADPQEMLDIISDTYTNVREFFYSLDMLIGTNSEEGLLYISYLWKPLLLKPNIDSFTLTRTEFRERVIPMVLKQIYGRELSPIIVEAVNTRYSEISSPCEHNSTRDMLLKLTTDYMFTVPCAKTAMLHSELHSTGKTFVYEFVTKSSLTIGRVRKSLWAVGATHGDEVAFVFGFSRRMLDALSINSSYIPYRDEMTLSNTMMDLWSNFAKKGTPNYDTERSNNSVWKQFSRNDNAYLELSTQLNHDPVKYNYGQLSETFWLEFIPKLLDLEKRSFKRTGNYLNTTNGVATCTKTYDVIKMPYDVIVIVMASVIAIMMVCLIVVGFFFCKTSRASTDRQYDAVEIGVSQTPMALCGARHTRGDTCLCAQDYLPVCGEDGITYTNMCMAKCSNAEFAYFDPC